MIIKNIMEEFVINTVNEIYDENEKSSTSQLCTCYQCRLDVICYVLNRISPKYIVSGRGLAHVEYDYQNDKQSVIDITALVNEGMHIVSKTKRPNASHSRKTAYTQPKGPVFNLPNLTGRLFHGKNFEPIKDINVFLYKDNKLVKMVDPNWQNPYKISQSTAGNFIFWPHPVKAEKEGMTQIFDFEIRVEHPDYENLSHFIEIELKSEELFHEYIQMEEGFKVGDLYLFDKGDEESGVL